MLKAYDHAKFGSGLAVGLPWGEGRMIEVCRPDHKPDRQESVRGSESAFMLRGSDFIMWHSLRRYLKK